MSTKRRNTHRGLEKYAQNTPHNRARNRKTRQNRTSVPATTMFGSHHMKCKSRETNVATMPSSPRLQHYDHHTLPHEHRSFFHATSRCRTRHPLTLSLPRKGLDSIGQAVFGSSSRGERRSIRARRPQCHQLRRTLSLSTLSYVLNKMTQQLLVSNRKKTNACAPVPTPVAEQKSRHTL